MRDMSHLADGELVRMFRDGGSDRAFEQLLTRYVRLIRSWTRKYWSAYRIADYSDLEQEAHIAFLSAVKSYDEAQSSFFGFAQLCVARRLQSVVKSSRRQKNVPPGGLLALSGAVPGSDDGNRDLIETMANPAAYDPLSLAVSADAVRRMWSIARSSLSKLELEVFRRRVDGQSYQEVAAELGVSTKSVDNAVMRARRKLRGFMSTELEMQAMPAEEDETA